MKKIKVELVWNPSSGFYRVTKLTNAATLAFRADVVMIGTDIDPRNVDEFARDRRWDVTILSGRDL